jgi:hypothetical protein
VNHNISFDLLNNGPQIKQPPVNVSTNFIASMELVKNVLFLRHTFFMFPKQSCEKSEKGGRTNAQCTSIFEAKKVVFAETMLITL